MTSSSSTSGSGSGSLSSQSIPSSMDSGGTLPTQDCVDGNWSEPEDFEETIWGKLYPVYSGKGFSLLDLRKEKYLFGRDTESDVFFAPSDFAKNGHFQALSKKHFELIKESNNTNEPIVYIKDWSSNGTFLNGELIGKGNKHVIQNNDEIELARPENKAYIYIDLKTINKEQELIPQEVKAKYTLSRILGRGACGEVKLAFSKGRECNKFAIKIISKKQFSSSPSNISKESLLQEVEILKKLNHPCIVKIVDVFDTEETLFIVLELIEGGELFDRVRAERLQEDEAKLIFYQILIAVQYLHDNGFTHRDLKPENVLLCSSEKETLIKITDFGVSKFVGEQSFMQTLCGTQMYLAPEVLQSENERKYNKQCDCWSLGVILFVCLGGYAPFVTRPNRTVKEQILQGVYSFPDVVWKNVSDEAKDLIKKFLTVDPQKRISIKDAFQHPWMQNKEIIEKAEKLMSRTETKNNDDQTFKSPAKNVVTTKRKDLSDDESMQMKRQKSTE